MYRYFACEEDFENDTVKITGDDFKHLKNTLRYKIGDKITVIYKEVEYLTFISKLEKQYIKCKVIEKTNSNNEPKINITLFQGLPKKLKMEKIIQQNVEIGVKRIVPVYTNRTIVKIDDKNKENKKVERWQKISKESAKQSKRNVIPKVNNIVKFKDAIKELMNGDLEIIVPYEEENNNTIKKIFDISKKEYAIFIGPEGGFEQSEIEELKSVGAQVITLGPRILRTETAGVVTSAIILHEAKELGGA